MEFAELHGATKIHAQMEQKRKVFSKNEGDLHKKYTNSGRNTGTKLIRNSVVVGNKKTLFLRLIF